MCGQAGEREMPVKMKYSGVVHLEMPSTTEQLPYVAGAIRLTTNLSNIFDYIHMFQFLADSYFSHLHKQCSGMIYFFEISVKFKFSL